MLVVARQRWWWVDFATVALAKLVVLARWVRSAKLVPAKSEQLVVLQRSARLVLLGGTTVAENRVLQWNQGVRVRAKKEILASGDSRKER